MLGTCWPGSIKPQPQRRSTWKPCSRKLLCKEVVGHITEGVCRPLKVRIEQVIIAEPGAVLLYKLSNLLKFYHHTIREVLASHDSSVLPLDARQADFAQVLSCILDPLLQLCTVSASNLGTADMATYMVNSLYMMKTTLALFEFTDKRLEMLEFQIEAHLDTLINEQATFVLTRAGLSHIYSCVQQHTAEQVQFDRYLASPDTLVMPQLNFLLSAAIKEQIFKQSTELVCRAYGEVYKGVTNPTNAYKDAESVLHRSPQQQRSQPMRRKSKAFSQTMVLSCQRPNGQSRHHLIACQNACQCSFVN
ncbi:Conserved oligomeric Golgi complex subunit 6 [Labeo rohita]|uniref:Conserved oligomeric Golgi complex subunit 6 n=1 Tax=Labeo rohita TaxID=84645 RepID=A0ABQ8M070_LABRO|nr:Conserved oligomeric Golgi complex subunit 6 [Labeo rohita]